MRGATGLDGDARGREAFEERDHVPATQLPAQDGPFGGIDAVELEDVLGRVHANAANLFHGRPPHVRSATTSPWHSDAVQGAVHPNTCNQDRAAGAGSGWRRPAQNWAPTGGGSHGSRRCRGPPASLPPCASCAESGNRATRRG